MDNSINPLNFVKQLEKLMERYLNDYHKRRSLAALKEVEFMLKHPLSRKKVLAQRDRLIAMRPESKKKY